MRIHFSPLFFHSPAPPSVTAADIPLPQTTAPIYYTPDAYGSGETFSQHPDFMQAKTQYAQIFTDINTFIAQYASHPAPLQDAFLTFIIRIYDGQFETRLPLLYGEGKRTFDTFHTLLMQDNIPLEKRLDAGSPVWPS
jgi:hypothetical protein